VNVDVFLLFLGAFSSMVLGAWIVLRILRREYLPVLVRAETDAAGAGDAGAPAAEAASSRPEA